MNEPDGNAGDPGPSLACGARYSLLAAAISLIIQMIFLGASMVHGVAANAKLMTTGSLDLVNGQLRICFSGAFTLARIKLAA